MTQFDGDKEAADFMTRIEALVKDEDPDPGDLYPIWEEVRNRLNRAYAAGWFDRERKIDK